MSTRRTKDDNFSFSPVLGRFHRRTESMNPMVCVFNWPILTGFDRVTAREREMKSVSCGAGENGEPASGRLRPGRAVGARTARLARRPGAFLPRPVRWHRRWRLVDRQGLALSGIQGTARSLIGNTGCLRFHFLFDELCCALLGFDRLFL